MIGEGSGCTLLALVLDFFDQYALIPVIKSLEKQVSEVLVSDLIDLVLGHELSFSVYLDLLGRSLLNCTI